MSKDMNEDLMQIVDELKSGLISELGRAVAERNKLYDAIAAIERAIFEEGRMPDYHKAVIRRHRQEWGTLWIAIDRALGALDEVRIPAQEN